MTATNHTEHYGLSQYTDNDHPTYTGDYNGDMRKIDAAIHAASQSGMTAVTHTNDLTGDGSTGNPLGVADTIARTEDIPSLNGYATTESVTQAIASAIADRLTAGDIKPGNGINIETSGNTVTISYVGDGSSGGMEAVAHDTTLTGDGTASMPLGVVDGTMITPSHTTYDRSFDFNDITAYGVYDVRTARNTSNSPVSSGINGGMLVIPAGYDTSAFQIAFSRSINAGMFIRSFASSTSTWTGWNKIAFTSDIPDVSALTSRIATLESQVSALTAAATPSATGLTATQLDTQYSDDYNIVRTGTPTCSNESEEPHHE